jgi:hypothetical protein
MGCTTEETERIEDILVGGGGGCRLQDFKGKMQ